MTIDRRTFFRHAAAYGGTFMVPASLASLVSACTGEKAPFEPAVLGSANLSRGPAGPVGFGELLATGGPLDLPAGFTAVAFGQVGNEMSDGNPTPIAHDGMAALAGPGRMIHLVRNHEDRNPAGHGAISSTNPYDSGAGGGTTTLVFNPRTMSVERDFVSLSGTWVNCAGGPTPWGSWLTCEETTSGPTQGFEQPHGYVFDVPILADAPVVPVPLKAMGRFVHEAVAVDPATGIVYETEDRSSSPGNDSQPGSGLFRFIPNVRAGLAGGGKLQALAVRGQPNYVTATGQLVGRVLPVTWVDIDEPDPPDAETDPSAVFRQGLAKGAAIFQRLEGCWFGNGSLFFNATSGGDAESGQVWQYRPSGRSGDGELILIFESPGPDVLDSPDNICTSPRGGLVLCEDGGGDQFLRGLDPAGQIFDIARNALNDAEFAGATFSPDGEILFVNIQGSTSGSTSTATPGLTLAITGPWRRGAV